MTEVVTEQEKYEAEIFAKNSMGILSGMRSAGKPVYAGTVPAKIAEKRHLKNKVAKQSRKRNR